MDSTEVSRTRQTYPMRHVEVVMNIMRRECLFDRWVDAARRWFALGAFICAASLVATGANAALVTYTIDDSQTTLTVGTMP